MEAEPPPEAGRQLKYFPLGCGDSPASVTPAQVSCLRQEVFLKGQVNTKCPLTSLWGLIECLTEALLSSLRVCVFSRFFFFFLGHTASLQRSKNQSQSAELPADAAPSTQEAAGAGLLHSESTQACRTDTTLSHTSSRLSLFFPPGGAVRETPQLGFGAPKELQQRQQLSFSQLKTFYSVASFLFPKCLKERKNVFL